MILHSLTLRNFRRFRHAEIEFPENIIGLLGRNGAGKSTLLEAIGWALYGTRMARTDKQQIRSQFADERESCEVELTFQLGGEKYRVWRSLAGKNAIPEAGLYRGDSLAAEAVRDSGVNEAMEKLLGLDYRAFEASIFAKQKELAALSNLQDEPRRKIISRLINLEAVDRARQHVATDASEKRKFLEGAQATPSDLANLEQQLTEKKNQAESAQALLRQREEQVAQLATHLDSARQQLEAESARRDHHQRLLSESAARRSRQEEMLRQSVQIQKDRDAIVAEQPKLLALQPAREEYEKLRREREALQTQQQLLIRQQEKQQLAKTLLEQIQSKQKEADEVQHQLADLQKLAAEEKTLDAKYQQAQSDLLKCRTAENELGITLARIEARGKDFKTKLSSVQELGTNSACPICTRPLAEHYPHVVQHFEDALKALRAEYLKINEERKRAEENLRQAAAVDEALRRERENFSAQRARWHELQQILSRQQIEATAKQTQLQSVQTEIQNLGPVNFDPARLAQLQLDLRQAENKAQELTRVETRATQLPEIENRLAKTQQQIIETKQREEELQAQLQFLKFDENIYIDAKRAHDEANAHYLRGQHELGESKAQAATASADLRHLEQALATARELQAAIAKAKHEMTVLDSLQEHLKAFRLELAGRLRPLIADRASELLRLITNGRYNLLELDESYNISLYDRRERYGLERFSGGEQDIANLCLRVAISQVVAQRTGKPPLQFIVLDEIFGSLDEERKAMVLAALQHLSNYFRQIFLITHIESIKESLPVVLQVEMAGEASEVKVI